MKKLLIIIRSFIFFISCINIKIIMSLVWLTKSKYWPFICYIKMLHSSSHMRYDYSGLIKQVLNERKITVLDVGAQGGLERETGFYRGFITPIMVEPIPGEAAKLREFGFSVIDTALFSSECKKNLYISGKNPGGTSLYKPYREGFQLYYNSEQYFSSYKTTEVLELQCDTISNSLRSLNISNLDYLKIDTQGAELEIIKGLGDYRPLLMTLEVQVVPEYQGIPCWTELLRHLYQLNYMTCQWNELDSRVTRSPIEMDMLFIPNYLTETGKSIISSREPEFVALMLIFGQIGLLRLISKKLGFHFDCKLQNLRDPFQ